MWISQGEYEDSFSADLKKRQFYADSDEAIEYAQEALEEIIAALSQHTTFNSSVSREKDHKSGYLLFYLTVI